MKAVRVADATLLIVATAITRLAFRSHYLYDVDSVNFALALQRFDPGVHQPHPPGYFLYVCLGRLTRLALPDANTAFVAISILFSCGTVAMIYLLGDNWFGRRAGVFAGMIFLFSPLAWFHGIVALTYIVEAFFSTLTGYLCWRIYNRDARFVLPAAMAVGIAAGFRPSSLLLLCPLLLLSLTSATRKQAIGGIGVLLLTLLIWFIPMIEIGGGAAYFSSLESLWRTVPSKGTVFNSSLLNSLARAGVIAGIYLLCFGCAAIVPACGFHGHARADRNKIIFTRVWMAPGLLFFTFVYLKVVNSGYLLAIAPPVFVWIGMWTGRWYANSGLLSRRLRTLLIGVCAVLNTVVFLFAPLYCSYGAVRRFETELAGILTVLPKLASPGETMIVGFDSHFLGYRHAGYYLPGYVTVEFPEVKVNSATRVFAMQNRDTRLESRLPAASVRNFIFFPLPAGDSEYVDYMARIRRRFASGALTTVERGGHAFTMGSVADLNELFPMSSGSSGTPFSETDR